MKWIKPSKINGTLSAPASKSFTIRAAAAAFLSDEETRITNPSLCCDALAALGIIKAAGAVIEKEAQQITIKKGRGTVQTVLNCEESGLCMRLFTPIVSLQKSAFLIKGTGSLLRRPMEVMEVPLQKLHVDCRTTVGFPPIYVQGPMRDGSITVDGNSSSQFISGLLMALPLCSGDSTLLVKNLKSKPYVSMTLSVMGHFGIAVESDQDYTRFAIRGNQRYRSCRYRVEGDWSSAAFLLAAGALGGKIAVRNLDSSSLQADRAVLGALQSAGAAVTFPEGAVAAEKRKLNAFDFNAEDCPDLFPPLAVLACFCKGRSRIFGVERLHHKESNRAEALISELTRMGASIRIDNNWMKIEGTGLKGGELDSHNDHRIAMAGTVAGLFSKRGVKVHNAQCVSKSYPDFYSDLKSIGGQIS